MESYTNLIIKYDQMTVITTHARTHTRSHTHRARAQAHEHTYICPLHDDKGELPDGIPG